jgi:hypothetical protein
VYNTLDDVEAVLAVLDQNLDLFTIRESSVQSHER